MTSPVQCSSSTLGKAWARSQQRAALNHARAISVVGDLAECTIVTRTKASDKLCSFLHSIIHAQYMSSWRMTWLIIAGVAVMFLVDTDQLMSVLYMHPL